MKLTKTNKQAGLTLIEITLVIAVLLGLISVLFIGVSAYREGSNRAKCILNMSNVQKAVRAYQNLYEKNEGDSLALTDLVGTGKLIETTPVCPSGGTYSAAGNVPSVGTVYLTCSLATSNDHVPNTVSGW
ncbi:MAG: type II secretion system protein [Verrucomicrobiota bacterium]|nr:type II secretion system protein [Verrucomicrobiota bacterium]